MVTSNLLFTPGPLATSRTVKAVMQRDLGSRDAEHIAIVRNIRLRLLELAHVNPEEYTTVLMQGSGTFGIESVLSSVISPQGKLLVILNGASGRRIAQISTLSKISNVTLDYAEDCRPVP